MLQCSFCRKTQDEVSKLVARRRMSTSAMNVSASQCV
jgi:hypothetical protein